MPTERLIKRAPVLIVAAALCCAAAAGKQPPKQVVAGLKEWVSRLPAAWRVGARAVDAADGTVWFDHQANLPLKPASTMKLFVSAAAIEHLGPGFSFTTRVYLAGDELWVVGGGDPGLGDERLAAKHGVARDALFADCAAALRTIGVRSLSKIVLDDSVFDQVHRHQDWPDDQAQRWYQAPVGGINFNDNCIESRVVVGDAGNFSLDVTPGLPAEFLDNRLRRGSKHRPIVNRRIDGDVFEFTGIATHSDDLGPASVGRPSVFFGHALKYALGQREIAVRGGVVRRRLGTNDLEAATLLVTHKTPLGDVLWRANTFSQNLFAECMLKSLAAYDRGGERGARPGGWADGTRLLREVLTSMGLDLKDAVFRDGSGLSHRNRVSAAQFVDLLLLMRRHPQAAMFSDSLAAAGEPGTMKRRYLGTEFAGRLIGKTGTIRGVSALCGYLKREDGGSIVFAILLNDANANAREMRRDFVRALSAKPAD